MQDSSLLQLLTPSRLTQEQRKGVLLLDTRPAEQFASFHIRGSIQISLAGNFASWAAIIINPAENLLLIAENSKRAQEARNRLRLRRNSLRVRRRGVSSRNAMKYWRRS